MEDGRCLCHFCHTWTADRLRSQMLRPCHGVWVENLRRLLAADDLLGIRDHILNRAPFSAQWAVSLLGAANAGRRPIDNDAFQLGWRTLPANGQEV